MDVMAPLGGAEGAEEGFANAKPIERAIPSPASTVILELRMRSIDSPLDRY